MITDDDIDVAQATYEAGRLDTLATARSFPLSWPRIQCVGRVYWTDTKLAVKWWLLRPLRMIWWRVRS